MSPDRSPFVRSLLLTCAIAAALGFAALRSVEPVAGLAATAAAPIASAPATSSASLDATALAVPRDGSFGYLARVSLARPTSYLQVRLRVRHPSGRLLFQKTQVRSDVATGTQTFAFGRELDDLDLKAGMYPVELDVRIEADPPNHLTDEDTLRIYDPAMQPLRLAVVIKVSAPPALNPDGKFVDDPAEETRALDEVSALASATLARPTLRTTLAIAPELLQEWKRVSQGYELAGPEGLVKVGAQDPVPRRYASVLDSLSAALGTGRLELLSVPYADPDIAGLASIQRLADLRSHYDRGSSACYASIQTTPSPGTLTSSGCLTSEAVGEVEASGMSYAIVSTRYLRSKDKGISPGTFVSKGIPFNLLVPDPRLGAALSTEASGSATDALFKRALTDVEQPYTFVPVVLEVGPGQSAAVPQVVERVARVSTQPWLRLATAGQLSVAATAASHATDTVDPAITLVRRTSVASGTPTGWWGSIAAARRYVDALVSALPANDGDAEDALLDSLTAQSASWAGPDGRWALADRGRAYATSALSASRHVLGTVDVRAPDLRLSGPRGSLPLSISNGSGQPLKVTLRLTPRGLSLRTARVRELTLLPAENYVTLPVDLRSSAGGTLRIDIVADTLVVASTSVTIRASYLDRLAVIVGIVLALALMLYYIRRRVARAPEAADE